MLATILHYSYIVNLAAKMMAMLFGGIVLIFSAWSLSGIALLAVGVYLVSEVIREIAIIASEGGI